MKTILRYAVVIAALAIVSVAAGYSIGAFAATTVKPQGVKVEQRSGRPLSTYQTQGGLRQTIQVTDNVDQLQSAGQYSETETGDNLQSTTAIDLQ